MGAYGVIYRCRCTVDNATYVIKEIQTNLDGGGQNVSLQEARMMQNIKHRNIVKYYNSFQIGDMLYLVMEYCNGGDLNGYI